MRLTRVTESGDVEVDDVGAALAKLAAYEDAHEATQAEYDRVAALIESRRAEGRLRGSTSNQLIAQKMSAKAVLVLFESHGVE
ncbi:hypothetical protein [Rubneribacter sp.]|nr:hypothetical protein [Candidatus Rubneribacter avistercoris]